MLGINLGTLGFLAEVDRQSIHAALDKLIADDYEIEERMMLTGTVWHGDKIIGQDIALNDIVIRQRGPLRVVRFKNYVNDVYLNSYSRWNYYCHTDRFYRLQPFMWRILLYRKCGDDADDTDRSAYIEYPQYYFSGGRCYYSRAGEGRRQVQEQGLASFDGDTEIPIVTGDRIVIQKASASVKILKLNHLSFVEVLRQKME